MTDHEDWWGRLSGSPHIRMSMLDEVPAGPGVAVLWREDPRTCLYVGYSEKLRQRSKMLHRSDTKNSALAKHMREDCELGQQGGHDLSVRNERKQFLKDECYFQAISLPGLREAELEEFKNWLIYRLRPRYASRVIAHPCTERQAESELEPEKTEKGNPIPPPQKPPAPKPPISEPPKSPPSNHGETRGVKAVVAGAMVVTAGLLAFVLRRHRQG
jgi:hypothetical protein